MVGFFYDGYWISVSDLRVLKTPMPPSDKRVSKMLPNQLGVENRSGFGGGELFCVVDEAFAGAWVCVACGGVV